MHVLCACFNILKTTDDDTDRQKMKLESFLILLYLFRHTFKEFVERYRNLINGCPPAHKVYSDTPSNMHILRYICPILAYNLIIYILKNLTFNGKKNQKEKSMDNCKKKFLLEIRYPQFSSKNVKSICKC